MTPIGTPFMARWEPRVWRKMWKVTAGAILARTLASSSGRFWCDAPGRPAIIPDLSRTLYGLYVAVHVPSRAQNVVDEPTATWAGQINPGVRRLSACCLAPAQDRAL